MAEVKEKTIQGILKTERFKAVWGADIDGDSSVDYLSFKEVPTLAENLESGDFVAVEGKQSGGSGKTLYVKRLIQHRKGKKEEKEEKLKEAEVEEQIVEGQLTGFKVRGIVPEKPTLEVSPFVHPIVSVEKIVGAFDKFRELKAKILEDDDYMYIDKAGNWYDGKPNKEVVGQYIKKTGWQKLALALSLDIEFMGREKHFGTDKHGKYYVWTYRYRISHPSGKYVITEGSCSSRDSFFGKRHGEIIDPNESDIMHTAQTVTINRGVAILIGGGVSAEEMMRQQKG